MSILYPILVGFLAIVVPGIPLSFALLGKTKLRLFEIVVIGFIFGLIFPPALTWFESYFMDYIHAFTFSAGLYFANVVVLTLVGLVLMYYQGMLKFSKREKSKEEEKERKQSIKEIREQLELLGIDLKLVREHEREEADLAKKQAEELSMLKLAGPEELAATKEMHQKEMNRLIEAHEKEERMLLDEATRTSREGAKESKESMSLVWTLLSILMILTFASRIVNIGVSPTFFEFDPYFDMLSTESILTFGYQYLHDFSAWPVIVNGSAHRMEPLIPYLEAFWYSISNPPKNAISTSLLSYVSSFYPPITAMLLVFVVFMFLYHEYGKVPALIGAGFAASMPVLITTFIAGEQLLEPWGIFSMFFFYASYLLAANNKKEWRYAVLAGIAFASTFLGAHYFTVNAGVLALYILFQGVLDVLRKKDMRDFYKMNAIVVGIIAFSYGIFDPYKSSLFHRIPSTLGVPVIISFPLIALLLVALFEYVPKFLEKKKYIRHATASVYALWLIILFILGLLLIFVTPLGNSVKSYIALSLHFTTPSSALFMTVQEFEPTGPGFNFAGGGFGPIGINALVWLVLVAFVIVSVMAIWYRDSNSSMLTLWIVLPLAFAGMTEVKYLPHFGVAYIIALSVLLGELLLLSKKSQSAHTLSLIFIGIFALLVLVEAVPAFYNVFSAAAISTNCNAIAKAGNSIGFDMFCNQVPSYWLDAMSWAKSNVGPYGPRILSWWDYGDWINWFGNSNAVLRGDNAVPKLDYETAARFVLGPADGYGPANLANFSNSVQAKYLLFDNQLLPKWGALDFLACVDVNETSRAYAIAAANGTAQPYVLGTSQCEIRHDPAIILVPYKPTSTSEFCAPIKSLKNETLLKGIVLVGNTYTNITYCVPVNSTSNVTRLYYPNGTMSNAIFVTRQQFYEGLFNISGQYFLAFVLLYLPNGPNDTITDAPSLFYSSNFYRGYYLGDLPGFTLVYPSNATGFNYFNVTSPIRIYELDNFTGTLPKHTQKPPWVHNNYTMPG